MYIKGAPMRITLNQYGDDEGCMLLDQVPHNEMAEMDIGDECWVREIAQIYVTVQNLYWM